jgi:hypothetical protein
MRAVGGSRLGDCPCQTKPIRRTQTGMGDGPGRCNSAKQTQFLHRDTAEQTLCLKGVMTNRTFARRRKNKANFHAGVWDGGRGGVVQTKPISATAGGDALLLWMLGNAGGTGNAGI